MRRTIQSLIGWGLLDRDKVDLEIQVFNRKTQVQKLQTFGCNHRI